MKKSENKDKGQDLSFQSIKIKQISVDPLLVHEIKEEVLERNEAAPIQDLTEVYMKQEKFDASGYQIVEENGMIVQEIKEESAFWE